MSLLKFENFKTKWSYYYLVHIYRYVFLVAKRHLTPRQIVADLEATTGTNISTKIIFRRLNEFVSSPGR